MSSPLFRPEVLQTQQAQWLGSIQIVRPPSFAWVTGISLLVVLTLVAFSVWGEVARKARLPGMLVPAGGLVTVPAPQQGTLAEWQVAEGEAVDAGQTLARISSERQTQQGDAFALQSLAMSQRRASLEAEIRLVDQQTRQRHDALSDRLRSLFNEERQAQADLLGAGQRVQLAQRNLQRFEELAASGYVSTVQAQQRHEELLDVQTRQNAAQRQLQALQREQQTITAEQVANASAGQASRQQLQRAIAMLEQEVVEAAARQALLVKAPKAGRITAVAVQRGQPVQPGQALLSLVPSDHAADALLEAHLFAPSRTAGFVQPGQIVWLRYAAYPYQKFGMARGEVLRVSESPLSAQELPAGQAQGVLSLAGSAEPLRRVTVRLESQHMTAYGERFPLTAGTALEADVVQEKRALWEWLFEPLLAARQHWKVLSDHPNKPRPGG
jgi:membrane fusion protein